MLPVLGGIRALALSGDDSLVALGDDNGNVYLADLFLAGTVLPERDVVRLWPPGDERPPGSTPPDPVQPNLPSASDVVADARPPCAHCGAANPPDSLWCSSCGRDLPADKKSAGQERDSP